MYEDEMAFMSCEDRNYYRDRRTQATLIQKPKGPHHWEVCDLCEGRGKVVNPSIDASGLSAEDFAEDPDFAEGYMSGRYDIVCPQCRGRTTIPVSDFPPGCCEGCGVTVPEDDQEYIDDPELCGNCAAKLKEEEET